MAKPRTKNGKGVHFPYPFEKNGRTGRIKKWKGKFGTYFRFAGKPMRSSFSTFEKAYQFLDREFSKLDTDRANSLALNPLNGDVRNYSELEQLLREKGNGATLREAVTFYLVHHPHKKFKAQTVAECSDKFIQHQKVKNVSPIQVKTLEKHFRRFKAQFGTRKIHEIGTLEISDWLGAQKDKDTGEPWSAKTRTSNLGSLVSLSLYARDTQSAIPDIGKTEFQKVARPLKDERAEVEIYEPEEIGKLLVAALESDIDMIPALVVGAFQGLRPAEFHAEGAKRPALSWEAFIWADKVLHITGQKIRSKANRDIPLHAATIAWLNPFREQEGIIWKHKQAHSKKLIALRTEAKVRSVYDGFRHSYASYRIRHLNGKLEKLAEEMGNSAREIINSYKRNVTDAQADAWFNVLPPADYASKMKVALALREAD